MQSQLGKLHQKESPDIDTAAAIGGLLTLFNDSQEAVREKVLAALKRFSRKENRELFQSLFN